MTDLTKTHDTDLLILQLVTEDELEELCYSSQYLHHLCDTPQLWHYKILTLYPHFPFTGTLEPYVWKKLYYKIKTNDFKTNRLILDLLYDLTK